MPKGSKTSMFISSTCYDLSQVRADLGNFAESMGFEPIMSEKNSFPINPSEDTLNNCLANIKNRADIFVLVVGGRYGSLTENGKSITNMEYMEACFKGIPKYVFVQESILNVFPLWKDNPNGDFSSVVDNPKLFEFVAELRESGNTWVFPFSNAQDITSTLRQQISYLLAESLEYRDKLYENNKILSDISAKALRLYIEQPTGWEWLFFAQLLKDNIDLHRYKQLDTELGISYGDIISIGEETDWLQTRFNWMTNIIHQMSESLTNGYVIAIGEPGTPSDIERLIHLAKRLGDGYESILDWKLQFLRVSVENEDFELLVSYAAKFATNAIQEINDFFNNTYSDIKNIINNMDKYEEGEQVTLTMTIGEPDSEDFHNEMERLTKIYC
ncbi:MAG: DUF4062 domain-containing protein [Colwellia sp.]